MTKTDQKLSSIEKGECFGIDWKTVRGYPSKINVKDRDEDGNTHLHYAARWCRWLYFVNYLIDNGADAQARNENGDTPLHFAAYNKIFNTDLIKSVEHVPEYTEMYYAKLAIRDLVEHGSLEAKNSNGDTPLLMATKEDNTHLALFLIERGANVNAKGNDSKTPLLVAVEKGNVHIVRKLVNHGADINAKGSDSKTSLLLAIEKNDQKMVVALLENGAIVGADELKAGRSNPEFHKSDAYQLLNKSFYEQENVIKAADECCIGY